MSPKKEFQGHTYEIIRDPGVRSLPSWRVFVDGKNLLPQNWNSVGAADAGAQTEIRRMIRKLERSKEKSK